MGNKTGGQLRRGWGFMAMEKVLDQMDRKFYHILRGAWHNHHRPRLFNLQNEI